MLPRRPRFRARRCELSTTDRCTDVDRCGFTALRAERCYFSDVNFDILSEITHVEIIAIVKRLRKMHGGGRWRKLKGRATIRLASGRVRFAELHWYEAHGIGKKDLKIKRYLDQP
jgi:hypothetical protein